MSINEDNRRAADLALAQRAGLAAAPLGVEYFRRVTELPIDLKADGSIVTEADTRVEQTVKSVLLDERPDDAFLGEETGESGNGRRRWILDGIDGTAVFVKGDPSWQTLLALEEDGLVTVAVASVPARGRMWWAARGQGSWMGEIQGQSLVNARRIDARGGPSSLRESRLGIIPPYDSLSEYYRGMVAGLVQSSQLTLWPVHASLLVASGDLDVAAQLAGKVWDYAAPSLIVEEAGGVFSGGKGEGHPVMGNAVYARSPELLAAALELLG